MSNLSSVPGTSSCSDPSQRCDACDLVDLAIQPLRYALAWNGDDVPANQRAPELSGRFKPSYPDLGGPSAHYTLRLLRAGYLYVYDEQADLWTAYEVDDGGYLQAFDFYGKTPPPNTGLPTAVPCGRRAGQAMARCIKVRNPEQASRVWLALTDTAWTEAVKQQHQSASYRERHMRSIDVAAWVASQNAQPHSARLERIFDEVVEYTLVAPERSYFDVEEYESQSSKISAVDTTLSTVQARGSMALISSPYPLASAGKGDFLGLLWGKTSDTSPPAPVPPMMVALDDPIGVAAELAALMDDRVQAFLNQKERVRPLAVSSAIAQMREAVGQQHVYDSIAMADDANERQADYIAQRTGSPLMFSEPVLKLDASDLASIRAKSWDSYRKKYDTQAHEAWQAKHQAEMAALDRNVIHPLATAHVALMQSAPLREHMACNYDPADAHSGVGYRAVLTRAIAATQDKRPCAELYERWLQGDATDRDNLLLRAYAINLDQHAEAMQKAAGEARVKPAELPLDPLLGLYATAATTVGKPGMAGTATDLIAETVGPLAKIVGGLIDGTVQAGWQALVALGVGVERPLQWVSTRATTREVVTAVMETMAEAGGRTARRRAVKLELRRLQILGVDLGQRHAVGFVGVKSDGSLITRAAHQADKAAYIRERLGNWRRWMDIETRAGIGASLLQGLAITALYKKATGGMKHERAESWMRMGSAAVGMVGGAMEIAGKRMEKAAETGVRYARWLKVGQHLAIAGRLVSAIGGVAMAMIDIVHAFRERKEGNTRMASLYAWSGLASGIMAVAALISWFALASVLFVIVIALAIAIMWLGDNARHDWLERGLWGAIQDPSQKYSSLEDELQQYMIAIGAD